MSPLDLTAARIGPAKGDNSPYDAPFRHNPGTRITLKVDPQHTAKGLLVGADGKTPQPFVFPAPPLDTFTMNLQYNWSDYDTISDGQFSRPSSMQLQTVQFDTIIVADDYPWVFYNPMRTRGLDIDEMGRELGKLARSGSPFKFIVEEARYKPDSSGLAQSVTYDFGASPVLQMLATLRTLSKAKRAGEPDALYITCGFVEHRIAGTTQRKLGAGGKPGASGKGGENSRTLPASVPLTKTLPADANTLHDLAIKYYGSAAKWTIIKDANPWLGAITATHDLGDLSTAQLKAGGAAKKNIVIPALAGGGRTK